MDKKTQKTITIGVVLAVALAAVSYAVWSSGSGEDKLQFGYVAWDGEIASTNVLTLVLEEAGFGIEMVNVDPGLLYQGLANGDLDFTTSAWLPVTHSGYWNSYGDDIDRVSTNLEGCTIGLAVPYYVYESGVVSIEDLNERKAQFDSKIYGIDAGAGVTIATEEAIESYGLDYDLVTSNSAMMLTQLRSAYSDEEWIVVTLWTPHWAFERWDLVMLEDPEGVYGGVEHVETLARQGFQEENPEAYAIIERFNWTQVDIQSVMSDIADGMSEKEAAQKWIDANRGTVDYWITGVAN
ncbi:glycine betaine ABC transporter substrate-binding protein [Methanomassiliicoccus luminyensis]|uniref:glycine betaine ABC transporter substrate-binding protein n=1 Tax=Methanomassiliicoccus luminyensis TaxID=1080712 RepID=UPI00037E76E7|nr:glycine betaine ABC transporter substrate-binding protein [Methanomassiliicoccus luminyensis]